MFFSNVGILSFVKEDGGRWTVYNEIPYHTVGTKTTIKITIKVFLHYDFFFPPKLHPECFSVEKKDEDDPEWQQSVDSHKKLFKARCTSEGHSLRTRGRTDGVSRVWLELRTQSAHYWLVWAELLPPARSLQHLVALHHRGPQVLVKLCDQSGKRRAWLVKGAACWRPLVVRKSRVQVISKPSAYNLQPPRVVGHPHKCCPQRGIK